MLSVYSVGNLDVAGTSYCACMHVMFIYMSAVNMHIV